jgi:hypothetical protein
MTLDHSSQENLMQHLKAAPLSIRRFQGAFVIFPISLPTLLGTSTLLGHPQESRESIREAQDLSLYEELREVSAYLLPASHRHKFYVAPLDILVTEAQGKKRFHPIEINGTGIGGLTNLPMPSIQAILDSFAEIPAALQNLAPLILIGISGKESRHKPRMNRLLYEKLLYAEALSGGFSRAGSQAEVLSLDTFVKQMGSVGWKIRKPTIVLGYMKDFYSYIRVEERRLFLHAIPVDAVINDRFFANISQYLHRDIDLSKIFVANRCFSAGSDKGIAISILNDFMLKHTEQFPSVAPYTRVVRAENREVLFENIVRWLREYKKPLLIKPQGTGLGHGIEFFLDIEETESGILKKIDNAIQNTEELYGLSGGAFPFSLFEFIDTCTIQEKTHAFFGHKYEVRIVTYREKNKLYAIPSIVKMSCQRYDEHHTSRQMLINNITSGAEETASSGIRYMLPLCRRDTLELLGIPMEQLVELCQFATSYIGSVLDTITQVKPPRVSGDLGVAVAQGI